MRVAILQRVCPSYRLPLFAFLAANSTLQTRFFIGEDISGTKVRSAPNLSGLDVVKLPTRFIWFGGRVLLEHVGLLRHLEQYRPDVVLCEGESNILSAIKAILYRKNYPRTGLVHWSLGGLPGNVTRTPGIRGYMVRAFRRNFDAFVTYSSYGKTVLSAQGIDPARIHVAVNVSNVTPHLEAARQLDVSQQVARAQLGIPDRFTALYVGTLDREKRLDTLLAAAALLDPTQFSVVVVGDGPLGLELRSHAEGLPHVRFMGEVRETLPVHYKAADVLVLPGRGGMVISEAMAYSLPVIAYQADGTERDLIRHGETGILLDSGSGRDLAAAIVALSKNLAQCLSFGQMGQRLVQDTFGVRQMGAQIHSAILNAHKMRQHRSA